MIQNPPSKQLITTLSSKGQVTLPIKVRQYLGLDANDKIAFTIDQSGSVVVTPAKYPDVVSLSGAAGKLKRPISWKEMREIAREDRVKKKYGK